MEDYASRTVPWHLWLVGLLSLFWNAIGAFDYSMSHLGGIEYMRSAGMDGESIAYIKAFPAWAVGGWALGVWGGVAGSILLLLRSRYAVWAFAISLLGVLVMTVRTYTSELPASMDGTAAMGFDLAIKIIAALLLWYAWTMHKRGVLH